MRILLATGIYPPDIGGPATYVRELAGKLKARGAEVTVVTYAGEGREEAADGWKVHSVSKSGGPLLRWWRYASALRTLGRECDIVYAFSGVSVGVPMLLSRLNGPHRVLRLGGDFGWERYTDAGGNLTLTEWYGTSLWWRRFLQLIMQPFEHIVFSTAFQEALYERFYTHLPLHSVIENALPPHEPVLHRRHEPYALLFLGRFVAFKNLPMLIDAMTLLPDATLTLVGEGPQEQELRDRIARLSLQDRVQVMAPVVGQDKRNILLSHDMLVLPSVTEISPNAALEARAHGLPVLLTEETGLSLQLRQGMIVEQLHTPEQIARAVSAAMQDYDTVAARAASPLPERTWDHVADEHLSLFRGLL